MMTSSQRLTTLLSLLSLLTTLFSQNLWAENSFTDWATVTRVEPVERLYTVKRPVEKCWMETVQAAPTYSHGNDSFTNEIIGGLLGGVAGNQLGKGRGKDVMTLAGAALGASIANDYQQTAPADTSSRYREVERCETIYETEERRERSHYRVSYRYNGKTYTTTSKTLPGESLRVRVTVTPE